MKPSLFTELMASVHEGGAILRGEAKPSRTLVVDVDLDLKTGKVPGLF